MEQAPTLALYLFEGCPYCERVRAAIDHLDLTVEERDVRRNPHHAADLVAATGRSTVPVLRTDGAPTEWMPESSDIVAHLYATYGAGRSPTVFATGALPTAGAVVAAGLFAVAMAGPSEAQPWLIGAAAVMWALRHQLTRLRRWWRPREA